MNGLSDLVSQDLASDVRKLILDVFQVSLKHLKDDLQVAPEEKGIFGDEEVAAFITKAWDIDATPADGKLSILHDDALVARSWEFVLDDIWERALEVKDRAAFLHHLLYGFATLGFIFFGELEFFGIWVWGVEVERDRSDVLGVAGFLADVADAIFVDLIDGHIETDVV